MVEQYGKHEYKNHRNGRGIEIWDCRQCGYPLNNITQRGQRKDVCNHCSKENRELKARMAFLTRKVMKVLHP